MLHEVDILGVYMPPFLFHLLLAAIPFFAVRWLAARSGLLFKVWNTGLFELALFVMILFAVVYA